MKRGDLTDDELKQCIMSLPEMKGIDERLIQLFTELVGKYVSRISMKEFSDEGMYGLLMRRQRLQEFIRNKGRRGNRRKCGMAQDGRGLVLGAPGAPIA